MPGIFPFSIISGNVSDSESLHLLESDTAANEKSGKSCCSVFNQKFFWAWTLGLLTLFILVVYASNPSRDSDIYPISLLNTGDRIQLRSIHSDLYIRVSDSTSSLLLDQSIPWKRGSTFEVEAAGECFILRSLTGKFVRVDSSGVIRSSSQNRYGATHFAAVTKYESNTNPSIPGHTFDSKVMMQVHLKMCNKNRWLQEVSQLSASNSEDSERESEIGGTESDISNQSVNENDSRNPKTSPTLRSTNMIVTSAVDTKAMSWGAPTVPSRMTARSLFKRFTDYFSSPFGSSVTSANEESLHTDRPGMKSARPLLSAFDVISVPQIRGVNLGGWFIPEVWMASDFYNGTGLGWGGSLCAMVNYSRSECCTSPDGHFNCNEVTRQDCATRLLSSLQMIYNLMYTTSSTHYSTLSTDHTTSSVHSTTSSVHSTISLAEERMADRLAHFINEEDLREIKAMGFNSVRLPVGYWNVMSDPYRKFAPANHRISLKYIDWCFETCERLGLTVLLDLHGAPGSQNGIDHSGCGTDPKWIAPNNIALSLQAIDTMAARYSGRRNLLGFELLNEPSENYGVNNHTALSDFYTKSYHIVRKYSRTALVIFNELYPRQYAAWNKELREPLYFNVVVDWHLYQFQYPRYTTYEHVAAARAWEQTIEEYEAVHPIIVGEWSMGTGQISQAGQPYVDAAVKSFERSSGWYLWNWKVQPGIGFDEWDVQGQHLKRGGLDPFKAIRDLDEENLNYIIKNERGKKPAANGDNVPGN